MKNKTKLLPLMQKEAVVINHKNLIFMKKQTNKALIITIITATILISGSLIYLGSQLGKKAPAETADLQAEIEKGITSFAQKQQEEAMKAYQNTQEAIVGGNFEDDDAVLGDKDAPVTLIEFSDFQCPYCRKFFNETLPLIKEKYIDTGKVKLVYRDFPLSFHKAAASAAMAAECAREQGGDEIFFKYHDRIFEEQNKLGEGTVDIPLENLKVYADDLGLNKRKFNECFDSKKYQDEVKKDFEDGKKVGVAGTPAFLLNGQLISGAQPFVIFEQLINQALYQ